MIEKTGYPETSIHMHQARRRHVPKTPDLEPQPRETQITFASMQHKGNRPFVITRVGIPGQRLSQSVRTSVSNNSTAVKRSLIKFDIFEDVLKFFLISNFRRVLKAVFFLLGDSLPASEFIRHGESPKRKNTAFWKFCFADRASYYKFSK